MATALHDVVHVTTVFVTHDQDEAMEVSDQIAVINHGRLEQVGSPRELYDEPASEFVMTFVGDAQPLGGVPRAAARHRPPARAGDGAVEAMIVRVTLLGRDAKVELHDASGAEFVVLMTRDSFNESGYWRGQTVWAQPDASASSQPRGDTPLRALEERDDALADADAERRQPVAAVAAASSWSSETTRRAPLIPSGCPSAIAPPFTLTLLLVEAELADHGDALRRERLVQLDEIEVGADDPAVRSRSLRTAGTGPMPMTRGSTPATADPTNAPSGSRPSSRARVLARITSAAAPSLMPLAFPAVTVPSGRNAGRSFASACAFVSGRGCSSTTTSPTETSSSSKRPAAFAAAHRCCDRSAKAS